MICCGAIGAASDAPVAEEIAAEAEPVADVVTAPVVEEPAEVVISQPEVVEEIADVVETAPVAEEIAAPQEVVAAPIVEATVVKPEVVAASVDAEHLHSHATAPMTRAPAPEYVPGSLGISVEGELSPSCDQRKTIPYRPE